MKKLILFLAFFAATGLTVNAQTCSGKAKTASAKAECAKVCSKTKAAKTTAVAASLEEAIAAAEADESVEKKVCSTSGKVSFSKKSVCSASGKVSYTAVEYDAEQKAFVNVSPSAMSEGETAVKAAMDAKSAKAKSCDPKACTKKSEKKERT